MFGSLPDFLPISPLSFVNSEQEIQVKASEDTLSTAHKRGRSMEQTYPYHSKGFDSHTKDTRPKVIDVQRALSVLQTDFQRSVSPVEMGSKRPYSEVRSRIGSFRQVKSGYVETPDPAKRRHELMRSELM